MSETTIAALGQHRVDALQERRLQLEALGRPRRTPGRRARPGHRPCRRGRPAAAPRQAARRRTGRRLPRRPREPGSSRPAGPRPGRPAPARAGNGTAQWHVHSSDEPRAQRETDVGVGIIACTAGSSHDEPACSGWPGGITPLPLKLVTTGASRRLGQLDHPRRRPARAAAGEDHRRPGTGEQLGDALHRGRVGRRQADRRHRAPRPRRQAHPAHPCRPRPLPGPGRSAIAVSASSTAAASAAGRARAGVVAGDRGEGRRLARRLVHPSALRPGRWGPGWSHAARGAMTHPPRPCRRTC